mmetsp:Transcript_29864/g.99034  ORF Transcript_29864/g.99034 Transcript_29864/m.99034 type:complete len:417 (+) Transcript_29864:65-1315(+)
MATSLANEVAALDVSDDDGQLLGTLARDELACVWRALASDDHFAFALSCKTFNSLRPRRRKFPWIEEDMGGENPMVNVKMETRLLSIMRSPTLQAWAASVGAPSIYPHWVEIYGLQGAAQYNGRVGRALGPPNDSGRVPVEVDAGAGELPRRGMHSAPSLKSILIKPSNLHVLTSLEDELVYACHAEGGGGLGSSWTAVLLPRLHSCFNREEVTSDLIDGRGNRRGQSVDMNNLRQWGMAGKTEEEMADELERTAFLGLVMNQGTIHSPPYKRAATKTPDITPDNSYPLRHARWGRVQRSPLLAKCGVRLAIQRVERPNGRARASMQNKLATFLMIDTESGFAPPHWQDGIGDTYIYRAPGAEDGMGNLKHLDLTELGFMWEYISGELGSGEFVQEASTADYRKRLAEYRERPGNE